jgi:hypothetical protein
MCACICEALALSEFLGSTGAIRIQIHPSLGMPFLTDFHSHSLVFEPLLRVEFLKSAFVIYSLISFDSVTGLLMGSRQTGDIGGDVKALSVK